ncbi:hypothetical protein GIB67_016096 [Kingdonia uniflora]|uniref:RING-type domain-containing protein n=1 Tax=Kingdonia uniflora TaxID=39325 RepID=A0A7J7L1X6_9MAGN|nr:hypothetical protein GIB67_016096 [Kingdonia uniflora]
MASSQIQMPSVAPPYPYPSASNNALRDHNRRRDRDTHTHTHHQLDFHNNFKHMVRDHLQTCIVFSSPRGNDENENDENENCRMDNTQSEESSVMRRRQSRILDRWAARQAREMIITIERQTHEAELLALSNSNNVSTRASTFLRESSPTQSDSSSVDVPDLRASSIVQRWREFEAEAVSPRGNNQPFSPDAAIARTNTTINNVEEGFQVLAVPEDAFLDWDVSSQEQVTDLNERVRVADIVRRLTVGGSRTQSSMTSWSDDIDREHPMVIEPSSPILESVVSDQGGQRDFLFIGNPPRVRGRQAMLDLLMSMVQERQSELRKLGERHVVSKFSHRGRIQSLLKLRFRQNEAAIEDKRLSASTSSELDQLQQRSAILMLRMTFSPKPVPADRLVLNGEDNLRANVQLASQGRDAEHSGTMEHTAPSQETNDQDVSVSVQSTPTRLNPPSTSEIMEEEEEASQSSDVTWQSTNLGVSNIGFQGRTHTATASQNLDVTWRTKSLGVSNIGFEGRTNAAITSLEEDGQYPRVDTSANMLMENPEPNNPNLVEPTDGAWLSDDSPFGTGRESHRQAWYDGMFDSTSENDEIHDTQGPTNAASTSYGREGEYPGVDPLGGMLNEEQEPNSLTLEEPIDRACLNEDSPLEISRESRRQAWYHDMVDSNSEENEEIRELRERRSVSNFLASDFRERMDRLVLSYLHRQRRREITESGEEEEEENPIEHEYHEVDDDFDPVASTSLQLPLPSRLRSWNEYQDPDTSNNSEQILFSALHMPQPSQPYYQDSQQGSPFANHHSSFEMELIYDLRGHMTQLHHEMSELRKSMNNCMGMQVKLQKSIKQEVSAAVSHSIRGGEATEFFDRRAPIKKGNCCICYEVQIDSLLYRCGHMCTCFKCAHELQWSSGKCPICRAPIVDVVRAYSDS